MPPKFRQLGDFHEYYSGAKKAPCLTIFVGGNHEASNHLFELYYGGWAAPNIYYMGAANILQLGPLRIAGLSGIWKGYDYKKTHFERLPYNKPECVSIFHTRELDVRKLLSVRTQVDVGLSHDWPRGVEWHGDHKWLFKTKRGFQEDAEKGHLGSAAVKECLERLRPAQWFSAHLHVKYSAVVKHQKQVTAKSSSPISSQPSPKSETPQDARQKVAAWQNFHRDNSRSESEERQSFMKEQEARRAEEKRTGVRAMPKVVYEETHKEVTVGGSKRAPRASTRSESPKTADAPKAKNALPENPVSAWQNFGRDVAKAEGEQRDRYLKDQETRKAEEKRTGVRALPKVVYQETHKEVGANGKSERAVKTVTRSTASPETTTASALKNSDEILLNMSDISSEDDKVFHPAANPGKADSNPANTERARAATVLSEDSSEGGVKLSVSPILHRQAKGVLDTLQANSTLSKGETPSPSQTTEDEESVPESLRAQLADISGSFAPRPAQQIASATLPAPEEIANTTTQFLALDKCEPSRDFLQLLEIPSLTNDKAAPSTRPFKLQYDKEWLAITRVFAPELELGGTEHDVAPPHKGDAYYRDRIIQGEMWVEKNVVQAGRLEVPENFVQTAPIYDPDLDVPEEASPREYTNPQTSQFCDLVGIDNKFDFDENDRTNRMKSGPLAYVPRPKIRGKGRGNRNTDNNFRGQAGFGRGGAGGANRGGRGRSGRGRGGRGAQ